MSTPTSLALPEGVRRTSLLTERGSFAALEALPPHGVCERETALLVPGYTGSKEDFLALLDQLALARRRVLAIDMRGQYQTPGNGSPYSPSASPYSPSALGADIAAICAGADVRHLLGHSFGGLVTREAVLDQACELTSYTLMSSGPAGLTGPRADELRSLLAGLADHDVAQIWAAALEPQFVAAGVPPEIVGFLRERMLGNDPLALAEMARYLLDAPDRTDELAKLTDLPKLVIYGQNDNAWQPSVQEDMAVELGAQRVCIPGAMHSPNVEAPATTASALTAFWNRAEA